MNKKLTKHGNSLALVIDKPILKLLNISKDTILELSVENGSLIMRPTETKTKQLSDKARRALFDKVADEIIDKYHDVFKKLAE